MDENLQGVSLCLADGILSEAKSKEVKLIIVINQ